MVRRPRSRSTRSGRSTTTSVTDETPCNRHPAARPTTPCCPSRQREGFGSRRAATGPSRPGKTSPQATAQAGPLPHGASLVPLHDPCGNTYRFASGAKHAQTFQLPDTVGIHRLTLVAFRTVIREHDPERAFLPKGEWLAVDAVRNDRRVGFYGIRRNAHRIVICGRQFQIAVGDVQRIKKCPERRTGKRHLTDRPNRGRREFDLRQGQKVVLGQIDLNVLSDVDPQDRGFGKSRGGVENYKGRAVQDNASKNLTHGNLMFVYNLLRMLGPYRCLAPKPATQSTRHSRAHFVGEVTPKKSKIHKEAC